ncbi:MAG: hypothetical protein JSV55_09070 [Deltaproteobacteria bacterium]|nr:MAG: hypothetical protein JSV55_09070 [Deltaproteobacteria bacterium]
MRISVKTLAMVVTVVISIAIAQVAWSATLGTPYEVTGTVYECEPGVSGIQIDSDGEIITVYGMGPASYWGDLVFPDVGDEIAILVCEITYSDGTSKLVAMSVDVDYNGEVSDYDIELRDDNGVPLWRGSNVASTQSRGNR